MLLIFRPFRIGDSIEVAGKSGTVKNLNPFMTELASGNNVQVLIPNGQVWGAAMSNFSAYGTRRISLSVPVMLDKDVETISSRLRSYLKEDKRVLDSPPPSVTASNLTDKGVELVVHAWAKTEDADVVRNDFVRHSMAAVQTHTAPGHTHLTCALLVSPESPAYLNKVVSWTFCYPNGRYPEIEARVSALDQGSLVDLWPLSLQILGEQN